MFNDVRIRQLHSCPIKWWGGRALRAIVGGECVVTTQRAPCTGWRVCQLLSLYFSTNSGFRLCPNRNLSRIWPNWTPFFIEETKTDC